MNIEQFPKEIKNDIEDQSLKIFDRIIFRCIFITAFKKFRKKI